MAKVIIAEKREQLNKGTTNRLRREGRIPAVVYGHDAPVHVHLSAHEFSKSFKRISESELLTLQVGSAKHTVLIKDYQKNVLRNEVIHLDFFAVSKDHTLRTKVPVHLGEVNVAVRAAGGMVELSLHEIEVECLPGVLPESITVDASKLTSGHAIHVRDLVAPKGVKFITNPDAVVVHLAHIKVEAVAATEAAAPTA